MICSVVNYTGRVPVKCLGKLVSASCVFESQLRCQNPYYELDITEQDAMLTILLIELETE